jgi:multiple sugar transport system substrate-binding protein/raffinose/stachyose/melibiose transport system substrate-binding protein
MKQRTLQLTTVAVALGLGAAACGGGSSEEEAGNGTVTVYHRWTGAAGDGVEAGLEFCDKRLEGVTIESTSVSAEEYEVQLPVNLSSSSPPDIYALWPGGRAVFQSERGQIAPITDFYNEKIAPLYSQGVNDGVVEKDGEIYVVPFNVSPNAFYYNIATFEKYGLQPPATWDEFTQVLATLKDGGEVPIALGSGLGWEPLFWFDYLLLRTAGSEFREDLMWGEESYTDPKVVDAMTMWAELVDAGYFNDKITSLDYEDMFPAVANGDAAMMLMGPWAIDGLSSAGVVPGKDFGMFPFPTIDPSVADATEGAMEGWATTGARDNEADVQAVLECVAGAEQLTTYATTFPALTPNPDVSDEIYNDDVRPFMGELQDLAGSTFHENLELATVPPVTEVAKREFPRFLSDPGEYMQVLEALDGAAKAEFGG